MKFCLSIDVAKGKSMVILISQDGEIIIDLHEVLHNKLDLLVLHKKSHNQRIKDIEVIMESTSTYHYPILKFFRDYKYKTIVLNPIISKEHKKNLRKTKTDKTDCLNLARIYFKDEYNKQTELPTIYVELQYLSRQIYNLQQSCTRFKNRFRQLIEMVFPEYEKLFKKDALFNTTALNFISKYPHANCVLEKRVDALANILSEVHQRHPGHYRKEAAKTSLTSVDSSSIVTFEVSQQAKLILDLQSNIDLLKEKLIKLAKTVDIYESIVSIYGLGEYTTALIIAEIKDPRRFSNIKKLIDSELLPVK